MKSQKSEKCDNESYKTIHKFNLLLSWIVYPSLILIFKKVVTEVSYEIGEGGFQACSLSCAFGPPGWFLVFFLPTICCNRNKDALHRCPNCQADIGKKPYKLCGDNSSCIG